MSSSTNEIHASEEVYKSLSKDSSLKKEAHEALKNHCFNCIKSSSKNTSSGMKINITEAIEKLELFKESLTENSTRLKIDNLCSKLQNENPKNQHPPKSIQQLIETVFAHQQKDYLAQVQATKTSEQSIQKNPFQIPNPFAAGNVQKYTQEKKKIKATRKKDETETAQDEAKKRNSFFSWIKKILK